MARTPAEKGVSLTLPRLVLLPLLVVGLAGCSAAPPAAAPAAPPPTAADLHPGHDDFHERDDHTRHVPTVSCKLRHFEDEDDCPPPLEGGRWDGVVPAPGSAAVHSVLGMQTVHAALLPSGRILLVSGSSWRNRTGTQYYPEFPNPETPNGLFIKDEDPFHYDKLDEYYELVNNAAIYDPVGNTFYRVPVPVPEPDPDPDQPRHFAPNDFFCAGHQHLPDGNLLFTGGTQYYSPFRTGNDATYVFDWRAELETSWHEIDWRVRPASNEETPWTFSGFMKRGRWYPSLVPLLDGRLVVFSGFVGFDPGFRDMHVFEINTWVEVFDPSRFDPAAPGAAWKAVDVAKAENGPFTTLINPDFEPTPEVACNARCIESNRYDAFKLYPVNYLQPDGRIYLTREGEWVSLRTCDAAFMRETRHTYWATLEDLDDGGIDMTFERGPDRVENVTSYGTAFRDPETGQIHLLGGQENSPGTLYPLNADHPTQFAGGRGSTRLETFTPDPRHPLGGRWRLDRTFLGTHPSDDRTMHYTVALPTGQLLVINGGNYDFYGPVHHPLLLTPRRDLATGERAGYSIERMLDALEPRLYHNAAILLPDGRVFVSGGNTSRATVTPRGGPPPPHEGPGQPPPDLDSVEVDLHFFDDGPMAKALPGQFVSPTENWTAEIYSPPYLFIDQGRRATVTSLEPVGAVDFTPSVTLGDRPFTLIKSGVTYRMGLAELPPRCDPATAGLALIKLPSATHGWQNGQQFVRLDFRPTRDGLVFTAPNARRAMIPPGYYMLFYTDCRGKPAVARMVRFDDSANAP